MDKTHENLDPQPTRTYAENVLTFLKWAVAKGHAIPGGLDDRTQPKDLYALYLTWANPHRRMARWHFGHVLEQQGYLCKSGGNSASGVREWVGIRLT